MAMAGYRSRRQLELGLREWCGSGRPKHYQSSDRSRLTPNIETAAAIHEDPVIREAGSEKSIELLTDSFGSASGSER